MKKVCILLLFTAIAFNSIAQQTEVTKPTASSTEELTPNEARARRGFSTDACFVPKGQWIFGGKASYSTHQNNKYKLLIIEDIDSEGYTVNVSPMIAYAPWKNMAVGVRFGYSRSMLALDNAALSFGDAESGINLNVDFYHKVQHTYTGTLFWRPYIPLGHSNRFAIFAEVQLNLSGSQAKLVSEDGIIDGLQNYRGTYSNSFGVSLGLQPGIMAFITNNTAIELSIGVFGIGYERTNQLHNNIEEGTIESSNMNFKVNLLSIGFGFSFYL
ncbi:MAG: hypothetical protein II288_07140 [Alistipes sp.]|jgi:hypothetical protein|nr:hypothetical protein [Alistipes sp.]